MWYEKYKKLNPGLFIFENSGKDSGESPPYADITDNDMNMVSIKGMYGMEDEWKVIGYTESTPFPAKGYDAIGIMFENKQDFTKRWWHYPKY
jgi:hypothetical protein